MARRQVPVVWIDIHEHGPGTERVDREEVPRIVVGGEQHFVAGLDAQRTQGQFDGVSAAAAAEDVSPVVVRGESLLQAFDVRPVILPPGAVAVDFASGDMAICAAGAADSGKVEFVAKALLAGAALKKFST